jgi:predicted nucleic-acid-binding protein
VIGLDSNVIVRYLAQDDPRQAAAATRLIEGSLTAEARGFVSIVTLAEVVWVMSSNYRAARAAVADIVEGLLTAPQLAIEKADVIWRALRAFRDSKADFSDAVIVELGRDAGCSKTVTFDRQAAGHPGFEALR